MEAKSREIVKGKIISDVIVALNVIVGTSLFAGAAYSDDTQIGAIVSSGGCGGTIFSALGDLMKTCWQEFYRRKNAPRPDLENQLSDDFTLPFLIKFNSDAQNGEAAYEITVQRPGEPIDENLESFRVSEKQLRQAGLQNIFSAFGRLMATFLGAGIVGGASAKVDAAIGTVTSAAGMGAGVFNPLYALIETAVQEYLRRRRSNVNRVADLENQLDADPNVAPSVIRVPFEITFHKNGEIPYSVYVPPVPEYSPSSRDSSPPREVEEPAAGSTTGFEEKHANVRFRATAAHGESSQAIQPPSRSSTDQTYSENPTKT